MTEQEWLASTDPSLMVRQITHDGSRADALRKYPYITSYRKLRLFAYACRDVCNCHPRRNDQELQDWRWWAGLPDREGCPLTHSIRSDLLRHIVGNPFRKEYSWAVDYRKPLGDDRLLYKLKSRKLVKQKVGPPFSDEEWEAVDWLTPTVVDLARKLYGGDQDVFAPLHDALLDAGLPDDSEIVQHFKTKYWKCPRRGICGTSVCTCAPFEAESHPQGCWAVDLILGKE